MHWLALWFRDPKVAGSTPAEDGQGYDLFGEITLENQRFFRYIYLFRQTIIVLDCFINECVCMCVCESSNYKVYTFYVNYECISLCVCKTCYDDRHFEM